jgi:hypothetical protein
VGPEGPCEGQSHGEGASACASSPVIGPDKGKTKENEEQRLIIPT